MTQSEFNKLYGNFIKLFKQNIDDKLHQMDPDSEISNNDLIAIYFDGFLSAHKLLLEPLFVNRLE